MAKKKVNLIQACLECSHYGKWQDAEMFCFKSEKEIPDEFKIPKWCLLPDEVK